MTVDKLVELHRVGSKFLARPGSVGVSTMLVLLASCGAGGITNSGVRDLLPLSTASVSSKVRLLADAGLVERSFELVNRKGRQDLREYVLRATPRGRELAEKISQI